MATPNRPASQNKYTEQNMQNTSFDEDFGVNAVETLEYTGVGLNRAIASSLATKITVSGNVTYVAIAPAGTAQSAAGWQCKKIDDSVANTTTVTWADGDVSFDNVATDLTALTYS